MAKTSPLKRARLLAYMTQTSVAVELGVSQSTYHRWEAGSLQIPEKKVVQIAKLFGTSKAAILGAPRAFDLFGVDKSVGDDRTYYGEVAIHFKSDGVPLLLPITEAAHQSLYSSLQQDEPFIKVESLDNRMVFVRRDAISDIYFSSEDYDDYGPETDRYDEVVGIFPDDDLWRVAEVLDFLSDVEDEFDTEVLADAKAKLILTDAELDGLVADGHVKSEDRQKVRTESAKRTERFLGLACNVSWQMGNCRREARAPDAIQLYEQFGWLDEDQDAHARPIFLVTDGYHRTIIINPSALDYISIPAHKFREGEMEEVEVELNDA
jgi:transcriptional regulator with XRE-family HTH domain